MVNYKLDFTFVSRIFPQAISRFRKDLELSGFTGNVDEYISKLDWRLVRTTHSMGTLDLGFVDPGTGVIMAWDEETVGFVCVHESNLIDIGETP